jgi:hypothetical protein
MENNLMNYGGKNRKEKRKGRNKQFWNNIQLGDKKT